MAPSRTAFLEKLMATSSPTGFEAAAGKMWRDEAATFADRVWADQHGNSFAAVGEERSPRIMLAGHIDEIGLMVTYIDDKGYLAVAPIGGWDTQVLPGQRVRIAAPGGEIMGVIGRKPIHLLKDEEKKKVVKIEELWVDIGATSKEEASGLVRIGDAGVLDYGYEQLRNDRVVARGFDDRIGAFVVLEALRLTAKNPGDCGVIAVATVQEEIGLRGAQTSCFNLDPQIGIAVDVTFTTDTPGTEGEKKRIGEGVLGGGPILARGPNINPALLDILIRTADEESIPYQIEPAPRGTGTDANAIQISRGGVPTALVSVPNRYMHSPCEMVDLKDVENCSRLIAHATNRLNGQLSFIPE